MKICIGATYGQSLINFRGKLIADMVNNGHEVICISLEPKEEIVDKLEIIGAKYYQIRGDRVSVNALDGIKMIKAYKRCFKNLKPDVCFLYMSKPVAFGGYAAIKCKINNINILINGLENAYYRLGYKDFIVRYVMNFFYKKTAKYAKNVFFQNSDDFNLLYNKKVVSRKNTSIINGSGVDMDYFSRKELPDEPVFLMASRLLWSKGIREFFIAVKIIKKKYPKVKILLVGGLDINDEAIKKEELDQFIWETGVEYHDFVSDIRFFIKRASVFVLPSYHEGLPRSIIEAMSMGRAIITTNSPGCKETVIDGVSGYLVPVKDAEMLAKRMIQLIENRLILEKMANESFELCKNKFEISKINLKMMKEMGLMNEQNNR